MTEINAIWITWENQRRNRELSSALGIAIYELDYIDRIKNRIRKYALGLSRTASIYIQKKPVIVFCQNPSLILAFFSILLKSLLRYRVVVDAHNAGLFPNEGKSRILSFLSEQIQKFADMTIVTNGALLKHVQKNRGRGFVLPDKIPDITTNIRKALKGRENILFICSFGDDEPYQIVINAAKKLEGDIFIYVTGDYSKKKLNPASMPGNVVLTGFLPENEYIKMLNSVDATIDLTARENCLVCGAYESLAAGKPMILSDTNALKGYFSQGAVYVKHTVKDMERAMREVLSRKQELSGEVEQLKLLLHRQWLKKKAALEQIVNEWL